MFPKCPVRAIVIIAQTRRKSSDNPRLELKKDPGVPRLPALSMKIRSVESRRTRRVGEYASENSLENLPTVFADTLYHRSWP